MFRIGDFGGNAVLLKTFDGELGGLPVRVGKEHIELSALSHADIVVGANQGLGAHSGFLQRRFRSAGGKVEQREMGQLPLFRLGEIEHFAGLAVGEYACAAAARNMPLLVDCLRKLPVMPKNLILMFKIKKKFKLFPI